MTLMCIERSQSPTHKGSFLQGRKSPENNNNNHNNNNNNSNNINQQNANNNNHNRRNSCSPPLSKSQDAIKSQQSNLESSRKLERSTSEPVDRRAVQTNSSRYKTELCRPFEENGTCKYGDKCQFAHGHKELRTMARHPKYKTELCRTFHSTGLCPYGPRCHFIHNSEQSKKSLLTNLTGRQKALSSLGSAGDISPVSSQGNSPTGMKSFDDLYKQQLSPVSMTQALINLNHQNFEYPVDAFADAFNFIADGNLVANGDANLDNYGYIGGFIAEYCPVGPASEDSLFRLPIFNRIQSK